MSRVFNSFCLNVSCTFSTTSNSLTACKDISHKYESRHTKYNSKKILKKEMSWVFLRSCHYIYCWSLKTASLINRNLQPTFIKQEFDSFITRQYDWHPFKDTVHHRISYATSQVKDKSQLLLNNIPSVRQSLFTQKSNTN